MAPHLRVLEELKTAGVIPMVVGKQQSAEVLTRGLLGRCDECLSRCRPLRAVDGPQKVGTGNHAEVRYAGGHGRASSLCVGVDVWRELPQLPIAGGRHWKSWVRCGKRRGLHVVARTLRSKAGKLACAGQHRGSSEQRPSALANSFSS